MKCRICSQPLTDDVSVEAGFGPECRQKISAFLALCEASEQELQSLAMTSIKAQKWINSFRAEMVSAIRRRKGAGAALKCLRAARRTAGHFEAVSLGLSGEAYFDYLDQREGSLTNKKFCPTC